MKGIFGEDQSKTISSLKNKFYIHLKKIKKDMYELVVSKGYFPTNPEKVRQLYLTIGIIIIFFGPFAIGFMGHVLAAFAVGITGAVAIVFSFFMPRKTKKGAETLELINGFKWFLSVTEKERLKFHNAPEKTPQQFEELLAYAMVLGVENEWAKQFSDMYLTPPEWYEGQTGTAFGAWYLASALSTMSTDMNKSMVVAPSRSSTAGFGGSGFSSGGGFSGGGFGGGGGGSW